MVSLMLRFTNCVSVCNDIHNVWNDFLKGIVWFRVDTFLHHWTLLFAVPEKSWVVCELLGASVTVEILWAEKIWSYSGAVSSHQKRREKWWRCVDSPDWLMWGPPASSLAGASCVTSVLLWMWNEAQNETFSFPLPNDFPLLVNLFCVISV